MSIRAKCDSCGRSLNVADKLAGKLVKCPGCGEAVRLGQVEKKRVADPITPSKRAPAVPSPPTAQESGPPPVPGATADAGVPSSPPVQGDSGAPPIAAIKTEATNNRRSSHAKPRGRKQPTPNWVLPAVVVGVISVIALTVGGLALSGALGSGSKKVAKEDSKKDGEENVKSDDSEDAAKTSGSGDVGNADDESLPRFDSLLGGTEKATDRVSAKRAIVKIEVPRGRSGMEIGTGFFINDKGWVATNHHVIEHANTDSVVKTEDGQSYKIAGVIADNDEYDLAIIELAEYPFQTTILDIGFTGDPPLGEDMWAYGHPKNVEFSLTKGIVSAVKRTERMPPEMRAFIQGRVHCPAHFVWIQHDAKIDHGSSGGPLFDDNGRVMGINTYMHPETGIGFASHVRYIREMAKDAQAKGATAKALPDGVGVGPSGDGFEFGEGLPPSIEGPFTECRKFGFRPRNAQHYQSLAELAKALGELNDRGAMNRIARNLAMVGWSPEHVSSVNQFAADQVGKSGEGIAFFGRVAGKTTSGDLIVNLRETDAHVVLRGGGRMPTSTGFTFMAFATVTSDTTTSIPHKTGRQTLNYVQPAFVAATR
jgi:S1-C subfamily serine protease/predicted RNA-binding Zn-ribbon protein involved in translation (DUF1610 family)